jgi:hypothetical protein
VGLALGELDVYGAPPPGVRSRTAAGARSLVAKKPAPGAAAVSGGFQSDVRSPDLTQLFGELGDLIQESKERLLPPKRSEEAVEEVVKKKKKRKMKLAMTASTRVHQRIQ